MQPEIELLTSNGDYGTIHMAISHGISVISTGLTEDKEEVSAHVQCSGARIDLRANKAIPEAIKHTLDEISRSLPTVSARGSSRSSSPATM
jgi:hypothetical protein